MSLLPDTLPKSPRELQGIAHTLNERVENLRRSL